VVSAVRKVLPELSERLDAISFRIPTGNIAASDMTLRLKSPAEADAIRTLFREEAAKKCRIMGYTEEHLVSMDFLGIEQSVFVDGRWIRINPDHMVKMVIWYDNEWGYSNRVADMVSLMATHLD